MSEDPAVQAAAEALALTRIESDKYHNAKNEKTCPQCLRLARKAVEAARPHIEKEVKSRQNWNELVAKLGEQEQRIARLEAALREIIELTQSVQYESTFVGKTHRIAYQALAGEGS